LDGAAALLFAAGAAGIGIQISRRMFRERNLDTAKQLCHHRVSGTVPARQSGEHQAGSGSLVPNSDANRSSATPQTIRTENREAGSFASGISKPAASASAATKTNVEERSFRQQQSL